MATDQETRGQRARPEATTGPIPSGPLRVVPGRSRVGFRVRRMGLYNVNGRFRGVEGEIEAASCGSTRRRSRRGCRATGTSAPRTSST
jgi:hypothetical protein